MISIKNLSKSYKIGHRVVEAVRDLSLEIKSQDSVAIIGPSGSGKSTLLSILGGLDRDYQGGIFINRQSLKEINPNYYRRYIVGTVFQQFYLSPVLTVSENILLPLKFGGQLSKAESKKRLDYLLEEVGLTRWRNHKPNELSGGQAQRVAIARALIAKPEIVLADEPTGNLDSKTGKEIIDLLFRLQKEEKMTLIMVSHDLSVIKDFSRKIYLKDGKIEKEI